jgi:hypothetical protein
MSKDLAQDASWRKTLETIERLVDASEELCDPASRHSEQAPDQRIAPHGGEDVAPASPRRCAPTLESEQSDPRRGFCHCGHLLSEHGARGCRRCGCVVGWELAELPDVEPTPAERLADLKASMGYKDPQAARRASREARELARALETEDARAREAARQLIREQLGTFTKDSKKRLEQTKPTTPREAEDVKLLSRRVWAIARQAAQGSVADLAYAVQQMMTCAPVEVVGCWVVEAMGLQQSGAALRQLHSPKARRKLVRSFVLWMSGKDCRLRQIAGSLSRRTVRGVQRVPQRLLARIASVGDKAWSRATTTRDATESHSAGLFRRVRLPLAQAHISERCGSSGQVVSRYYMELPRQPRLARRTDPPSQLVTFFGGCGVKHDGLAWVREQAKQAIVYAMRSVDLIPQRLAELVAVPGMLSPLLPAPL